MNIRLKASPGSSQIPEASVCLRCGKNIGEIEGFVRLTSGAILYCNKKRDSGGPSVMMDTVFSLWYHGPHPVTGTTKEGCSIISMNNEECQMDIVEPVQGGQVDIHFCSTTCLGSFFESVVTQFDEAIKEVKEAK